MLSEEDFKHKYLQHPITFLTEENLEKLETHCIRASRTEIGVEHKVVLELLDRYYQYKKKNEELKATINKQSIDISNNLLELQQKDKQIDLMINFIYEIFCKYPGTISHALRKNGFNDDQCGTCENTDRNCIKCLKQYFKKQAKEKGEEYERITS